MPKVIPYLLSFQGGLHVGSRGVSLAESRLSIPSDTLFAAAVDCWRQIGSADEFTQPFSERPPKPPFVLTSAFPYVHQVLFFPMPVDLRCLFSSQLLQERSKDLKKIRYLSLGLLQRALNGELLDDYIYPADPEKEPDKGAALQRGSLWFTVEEGDLLGDFARPAGKRHSWFSLKAWEEWKRPRVTVSRINSAPNLFHSGEVHFAAGCGLWFGISWFSNQATLAQPGGMDFQQAFALCLQTLADEGIGGRRTSGSGAFSYRTTAEISLGEEPGPEQLAYLLSRYHPREDELPGVLNGRPETAYSLTSLAGWLRSPNVPAQRRKQIMLVNEGSLVLLPHYPAGDLVDIRPEYGSGAGVDHPVYRYGLTLALKWPNAPRRS